MASIRQIANCIGLSGEISILQDFYGYWTGAPQDLSLLTQVRLLQGKHIHLNLIRVGVEAFTPQLEQKIDAAVQFTRNIYANINLGIGRVGRYNIEMAKANGHEVINSNCEAEELMEEWTVPNDALDVFFVLDYASGNTVGCSGIDEDCEKHGTLSGSVVSTESLGFSNDTGLILAHEIGHYLAVSGHNSDANNLMFFQIPNGGFIPSDEAEDMKDHCFVKPGCP